MSVGISLFAGVGQQFFDNSGIPLAGGLIYTYEAGTSTPATTYTSSSGATPHANPIVLDAAGRVASGEIWLTTTTVYKFVLKTSAGVTIATYDNVGAVPSVDGLLLSTNNLSDLTNVATARTNLGLGTAATAAATSFASSGANSNITSITGLTTPLAQSQGGTGTTGGVTSKIQPITATQAAGALTFTLNATTLDFRSTTLPSGAVTTITNAALTLVLPSGGTLGSPTTVSQRLILVAINNAGASELAVVNLAGGNNLTETGLINTVTIDTASDADNVFYSNSARTGVAYRVVGAIDCINTAGAWGTPTLVQGYGGQALATVAGNLNNIQYFTATGTYTPTAGTAFVVVEVVGGGGGGAGRTNASFGGGSGGAGAYGRRKITSSFSGVTVTIGAGGAGGAGGGSGTAGGTTSFGALVSCTGGGAGVVSAGGAGGTSSSGDVNIGGGGGAAFAGTVGGVGGGSFFGGGGVTAATAYGSGGGGGTTASLTGYAGADGLVIISEYK